LAGDRVILGIGKAIKDLHRLFGSHRGIGESRGLPFTLRFAAGERRETSALRILDSSESKKWKIKSEKERNPSPISRTSLFKK